MTHSTDGVAVSSGAAAEANSLSAGPSSPERRRLLAMGLAIPAAATLLTAAPAQARDLGVGLGLHSTQALYFLEEIETMQADFFGRAAASLVYRSLPDRARNVINAIGVQDQEHKSWFKLARRKFGLGEQETLFASPLVYRRPSHPWNFPAAPFKNTDTLLSLAASIKDTTVGVYHTLVGDVTDDEVAQALAALAGVEGRHAAALREVSGANALPAAFEPTVSMEEALRRFAPYGFQGVATS